MHKARAAGPWPAFNSLWFAKKLQGFDPTHPKASPVFLQARSISAASLCAAGAAGAPSPSLQDGGAGNAGHKGFVHFAPAGEGEVGNKAPCTLLTPEQLQAGL